MLLASAVNHDGPSSGLTVPNGPAQETLLREALTRAGVTPGQVGYLEAHGTGTPLGDPIELGAAGRVLAAGRPADRPLVIGSVKTNIGHLEAAAGVAGLIKVVLALQHAEIPAHLHFDAPSPHIASGTLPVVIPAQKRAWPAGDGPRIAGLSSFGMSGTNAHVLVQEAPPPVRASAPERGWHLLPLSARSEAALRDLADRFRQHLDTAAAAELGDIAFTAAVGRSAFSHRLAVLASSPAQAQEQLIAFGAGQPCAGLVSGTASDAHRPAVAHLFVDTVPVVAGLGQQFYRTHAGFRRTLQQCDRLVNERLGWSLLDFLYPATDAVTPIAPHAARTAQVAVQVALAQLWQSWGIEPAWVIGQGAGEFAAATAAGVFDLDTAILLAAGAADVDSLRFTAPRARFVSAAMGEMSRDDLSRPEYWRERAAQPGNPVRALAGWHEQGNELVVAVGPGTELGALAADGDDWRAILNGLARLYTAGVRVNWADFYHDESRRRLPLPTYPFQRKRHWLAAPQARTETADRNGPDWLYETRWLPAELSVATAAAPAGRWIICGGGELTQHLTRLLEARGAACVLVEPATLGPTQDEQRFAVDPGRPDQWDRLVQRLDLARQPCHGVVHLWSADAADQSDPDAMQALACASTLHLVQALVKSGLPALPRIWLVTRKRRPCLPARRISSRRSAALGARSRPAFRASGNLGRRCGPGQCRSGRKRRVGACGNRAAGRPGPGRLPRRPAPRRPSGAQPMAGGTVRDAGADRTYLITGGLGSLGLKVAGWMIAQGARHLVLTGRSAPSERARDSLTAWERQGVQVVAARADVANRTQLADLFAEIQQSLPPLAGVIHLAGVLDDGVLLMQDWSRFVKVMAPKVAGAWNLSTLTERLELDFFVLFSSMASVLGSPGQGNYAAANAYLDALAAHRRARGLPAVSIAWGAWADVGMAAELARRSAGQWTPEGVTAIPLDRGLESLGRLLTGAPAQVAVLPVDWAPFLTQFPAGVVPPVLAEVARLAGPRPHSKAAAPSALLQELGRAPAAERRGRLIEHIRGMLAQVMGLDEQDAPSPQQGFFEMGLDSLMAIELRNRLGTSLGQVLPATIVFQYPTIAALADHIVPQALPPQAGPAPSGLDDLSEDELLTLLAQELDKKPAAAGRI